MPQWRVRDVMTTEVITAPDDAPFTQLAAVLAAHRISAVAITDRFDAVVGVVSWTDLIDQVDVGEPNSTGGGGQLTGRTGRKPTAITAVRLSAAVAGVTDVIDQPAFDVDDTATDHRAATRDSHPLRGWWTEHRLPRQVPSAAAGLDGHDGRRTHADAVTGSAARRRPDLARRCPFPRRSAAVLAARSGRRSQIQPDAAKTAGWAPAGADDCRRPATGLGLVGRRRPLPSMPRERTLEFDAASGSSEGDVVTDMVTAVPPGIGRRSAGDRPPTTAVAQAPATD